MFLERSMQSPASSLITIVRAGAGAGKTRSLVHQVQNHFHHFMKEKERAPRMIVTTFTRKATQELRERLLLKATSEKDWAFVEYLQSSDLFVTTIHGVLNSFLKKVSHLTGQDPSFQIIGDQESQRLSRRILQKMIKEERIAAEMYEASGYIVFINPSQKHQEESVAIDDFLKELDRIVSHYSETSIKI